jgi:DnaJ-class molecular chaperone
VSSLIGRSLDELPDDDSGEEWDCTHCAGEGTCDDNANPLWDCDDHLHSCHACGGSGKRSDQRIF